jgi:hypothetical protein
VYSKKLRRFILRGGTMPWSLLFVPLKNESEPQITKMTTSSVINTWVSVNPEGNIAVPAWRASLDSAQWFTSCQNAKRLR